jgi:hypothetical protein
MTFALRLRVDVHDAGLRELLETLRQDGPRYERRGVEQFAEGPCAETQLPHDDRGPTIAEDFGRFGDRAKLSVRDHERHNPPRAAPGQVRFSYFSLRRIAARMERSRSSREKAS